MPLKIEDFELPQELDRYKQAVRDFTRTDLEMMAVKLDQTRKLPKELLPMLKDAGLLRLRLPKEYGGFGLTFSQFWPILAEVAKSHGSIRMMMHGFNGTWTMLHYHGTKEQKDKWLREIWVNGTSIPAFAFTEPDSGTGIDIRTTARKEDSYYILNGKKHLISWADNAKLTHVVTYTGDRSLGVKGISVLLVESNTPGFKVESHKEAIGCRGAYHGILTFDNCRVPVTNLLGKEGDGLDIALKTFLDVSRLGIAVGCLGPAERMLELSAEHAHRRVTFGRPIGDRQAVQQILADMATDIYATRCMIEDCAKKYDAGEPIAVQASMCKLFAIEMTQRVSDKALIIHGGVGITADYTVERHYRDVRDMWFEEGTPNIQRLVIGRDVLGKAVRSVGK